MQDSDDAFPEVKAFNENIQKLYEQLEKTRPDPSGLVFHYTNASGLEGILRTGRLWLTDIFSLNDPSELKHGYSTFVEFFKERARHCTPIAQAIAERFEQVQETAGFQKSLISSCSLSASMTTTSPNGALTQTTVVDSRWVSIERPLKRAFLPCNDNRYKKICVSRSVIAMKASKKSAMRSSIWRAPRCLRLLVRRKKKLDVTAETFP